MNSNNLFRLVKFNEIVETHFFNYINEWIERKEKIVPSSSNPNNKCFMELQRKWVMDETEEAYNSGFVPSTLYFLTNNDEKIIGAIHFRHELNKRLYQNGGHIGYGIRPTERKNGYATIMLRILLKELKSKGHLKFLLTCDEDNIASIRTIEKCGGVLMDKVEFEGTMTRRYWINVE